MSPLHGGHVLVLDPQRPRVDAIEHLLSGSGEPLQLRQLPIALGLAGRLEERPWDVVLIHAPDFSPPAPLLETIARHSVVAPPVLSYGEGLDEEALVAWWQAGVVDHLSLECPGHFRHRFLDTLERGRRERRLQLCEARLRECGDLFLGVFEPHPQAMAYLHEGMHILANRRYRTLFGDAQPGSLETRPLLDLAAPVARDRLRALLRRAANGEKVPPTPLEWCRCDGSRFTAVMHLRSTRLNSEPALQLSLQPQQRPEAKVVALHGGEGAVQWSVGALLDQLQRLLDQRRGGAWLLLALVAPCALEEEVGVVGAEEVLQQLGTMLAGRLPRGGTLARLGNGVVAVLLPDHGEEEALRWARVVREAVESAIFSARDQSVTLALQVGVAVFRGDEGSRETVVERAEMALALVRGGEEGGVQLCAGEVRAAGSEWVGEWVPRLRQALENGHLLVHYLPIVALHGRSEPRYELLLRLKDDGGDRVTPDRFLYVAERAGMAPRLDRWVLQQAWTALTGRGGCRLFVKLTSASLRDAAFRNELSARLREDPQRAARLVVEIDEADAASYLKEAKALVEGLRGCGVRVALEHFAGQPESFRLLRHLTVDCLKIDAALVEQLMAGDEALERLRRITTFAREHALETIAERVESAEVLSRLWQARVDYVQGHYLREPTPALDYDFGSRL